jgi:hypothetical protein
MHTASRRSASLRTISFGVVTSCGTLLLSACMAYKPTLFLDPSPATIPARVLVVPLRDASPADDKEHATAQSFSQTSPESLEAENLSALVTRAVTADFSATSVFQSVGSTERFPDLILSGTIHRFHGEVTLPGWAMIPGVGWAASVFWSPVQERHGEVDLELTLANPDGTLLGRYRGCDRYGEIAGHEDRYWSMPVYPAHSRLNQSFTEAVRQIRDQMLQDRLRLLAALQSAGGGAPAGDLPEPVCTVSPEGGEGDEDTLGRGRRP